MDEVSGNSGELPAAEPSGLSARLGGTAAQIECLVEVLVKTCESLKEERDQYRDEGWRYRKLLNQIRDNPNTRYEVEAQLGGILDVLDA